MMQQYLQLQAFLLRVQLIKMTDSNGSIYEILNIIWAESTHIKFKKVGTIYYWKGTADERWDNYWRIDTGVIYNKDILEFEDDEAAELWWRLQ